MYAINLNIKNKKVLIIGGGKVALRKLKSLLLEKAEVEIIAPHFCDDLENLIKEYNLSHKKRTYEYGDMDDKFLVFLAIDDEKIAASIIEEAEEKGILINIANNTKRSSFILPATLDYGDVSIAIQTMGKSPAFSRFLKNKLGDILSHNLDLWLNLVYRYRQKVKQELPTQKMRESFWRFVLDDYFWDIMNKGDIKKGEEVLENAVSSFRAKS